MPTSTTELESLVTKAQEATKNLDNADLRKVAFERVLDHLLGNCGDSDAATSRRPTSPEAVAVSHQDADGVLADEQQRIDALARYFKISPEDVGHIFDASEEEPKLAIPIRHLSEAKTQATREIALLVTGALTALGLETTTSQVKGVAHDYGKHDSANFMATLTNLDEVSVLGKPKSKNRVMRMKVAGVQAAQAIAQRIVG